MQKLKYSILAIIITASASFFSSCDGLPPINIFSLNDDVSLGADVQNQIEADPAEYPLNTDPTLNNYVNQVFNNVLTSSDIKYNDGTFPYQIKVIDRSDVMNAFAIPGGYIYVYTGLLKYLDNEAALAGIIAHEVAHCEKRHSTTRLTQYYGVSILLGLILGDNPGILAEIAANLFVNLAFLANSRINEDEADEFAYVYLESGSTGYYPGSVKFFFEQLKSDCYASDNPSFLETFLSTHPQPVDRIATTNQRAQSNGIPVINASDVTSDVQNGFVFNKSAYQQNVLNRIPTKPNWPECYRYSLETD